MFHTVFASTKFEGLDGRCSGVYRWGSAGVRLCRRRHNNLMDKNLGNISREIGL